MKNKHTVSWFLGTSVSMAICMQTELKFEMRLCNPSSNNIKLCISHSTNGTDTQNSSRILIADESEILHLPDYKCNLQKNMM
jgi:hypothetical protein